MDITQLLIPHTGKLDGELQIPMTDADKPPELLGLSFGMVFATHEMQPDHKEALPLGVQGDASAEPVDDTSDQVDQMEPENGLLREVKSVVADAFKHPDQMQAQLPEARIQMPVESDSPVHESAETGRATDAHVPVQSKIETAKPSQDPIQPAATVDEAFDQSTNHTDIPEIDRAVPSQLVESREPTVQGVPANPAPAADPVMPNELPTEIAKSQLTSEEPGFTRGTEPRSTEKVDQPRAHVETVFLSPAESVVEAQIKPAKHPPPASGPIQILATKLDGGSPERGADIQRETGRPTPDSTVTSGSLGTAKIEHPLALTPASGAVEHLQSVPKPIGDSSPKDPISITIEETYQIAARVVELRGNGIEFAPVSTQAVTYPVGTAPLVQMLEGEVERQSFDDPGFRIVEQVSATTGDLKSNALARTAELPRIALAQIADVVRQQPDRPVELTLSPEELGRLRMSFQSEGSAMHVTLSFERPDTLDLMRRHIDQLAQDLRASGMSEVSFTFQQQTSDGGGDAFPNGGSAGSANEQHSDPRAASDDIAPIMLNITSGAGVDIRV